MTAQPAERSGSGRVAVVATWVVALVGVVVVVALVRGPDVFAWLALALTLAVVAGFVGQLAVGEQHGFTGRLSAAVAGAFAIVAVAAAVALAVG